MNRQTRQTDERREDGHEEIGVRRVAEDLEHRIDGDERGRVFAIRLREFAPYDDHRDAPGEPDQDQPDGILGLVCQERQGKTEH